MIGPSSGTGGVPNHQVSTSQSIAKKRIFDDLDIENFCEEVQNSRKRYQYQELESSMELVGSGDVIGDSAALFSPMSGQEATEECPMARLEVLLVDGTNCTWTTVSELDSQQSVAEIAASPSTSSSSSEHRQEQVAQVEGTGYQTDTNYWEPVVAVPPSEFQQTRPSAPLNSQQQQQQQYDDQETGNLSWLLDFKLDPFIEAADDRSTVPSSKDNHNGAQLNETWLNRGGVLESRRVPEVFGLAWPPEFIVSDVRRSYSESSSHQETGQSYPGIDNRNFASPRCNGPKKPPFTYTELIEHALRERGELTVSAIYQWIS